MADSIPIWRKIQRQNFTSLDDLASFLELTTEQRQHLLDRPKFSLSVPLRLAQKIRKQTIDDPILRQFVPLKDELVSPENYSLDPTQDRNFCRTSQLLQKYHGRALLITSNACALHCRFCFRKNFPYAPSVDFSEEIQNIANDSSLQEIILSGGDPLSLSNESLAELFESLAEISHLRRIRIHTRFPIGIPERIDEGFLQILRQCPKQIWMVVHTNHTREMDADIESSLKQVQRLGIPILSQSVLLRGVNDDESSLLSLFETLINQGIHPYYLHLLDHVAGSAHFYVSQARGLELISFLKKKMSGYGVPKLVQEEAGQLSKTVISE
jgi:EF-P beta-lysylation protein EpmB